MTHRTILTLDGVVAIHAQEAASLFETRLVQVDLPHVDLGALARIDGRIAAHLDGLAEGAAPSRTAREAEPDDASIGAAFSASVRAIEDGDSDHLHRIQALALESPPVERGVTDAMGWVERRHLQGIVRDLLQSDDPARRSWGLSACAMQGVDPGLETGPWLTDPAAPVRARALRAAGELGLAHVRRRCIAAVTDNHPECRFWASWAAVLLGDRGSALEHLNGWAVDGAATHRRRAFRLSLQAKDPSDVHEALQSLRGDPTRIRWLLEGGGINGEPGYVRWLIARMDNVATARPAGEAFTLITGAELDAQQLWRARPEGEFGPSDDPGDEDVSLDADEGLMWPDPEKVETWWERNANRFQKGQRYFMGAPVTRESCIHVLKTGYQRQRVLAAHHLCLLEPGTPLFNTSAPSWRQQRLLDRMR